MACADIEISHIQSILTRNTITATFTSLYFAVCSLPFLGFVVGIYRSYNSELKTINKELASHKKQLEELVRERTLELEKANTALRKKIDEKMEAEKKREMLIAELQAALSEVKSLSGLLPICSSCKKVRDDEGYWSRLETYISHHSGAEFSHGLCPACMEKLYGKEKWYQSRKW